MKTFDVPASSDDMERQPELKTRVPRPESYLDNVMHNIGQPCVSSKFDSVQQRREKINPGRQGAPGEPQYDQDGDATESDDDKSIYGRFGKYRATSASRRRESSGVAMESDSVPPFFRSKGGSSDVISFTVDVASPGDSIPSELRKVASRMGHIGNVTLNVMEFDYKMQPVSSDTGPREATAALGANAETPEATDAEERDKVSQPWQFFNHANEAHGRSAGKNNDTTMQHEDTQENETVNSSRRSMHVSFFFLSVEVRTTFLTVNLPHISLR